MSLLEIREAQSDTHQMTNRETMVPKLEISCHKEKITSTNSISQKQAKVNYCRKLYLKRTL